MPPARQDADRTTSKMHPVRPQPH